MIMADDISRYLVTHGKQINDYQVEGRSWIYVQHVNLAFLGGRPVNLRATRKFTGH